MPTKPQFIVISNRLPLTIVKNPNGEYEFSMSSGGLVSALSGMQKQVSFRWIGWPGMEIPLENQAQLSETLLSKYACIPVFIDNVTADRHYNGFSNSILWPLFHYHPGEINFDQNQWESYTLANEMFADVVANVAKEGDIVWVHDYHLMLLPSLLKKKVNCKIKIGFFLHTPFPSSEIYSILPVRKQVLLGILDCDLIGFHTYDYVRHFLSSCSRVLGLHTSPNGVSYLGRMVYVGTFPIGIEPDKFIQRLAQPNVQEKIKKLKQQFSGYKILIGVDRLDYIKGIPLKLLALDIFLSTYPEWIGKLILIQVAVPSRGDVEEYQNLQIEVNELVGRINGRYGTIEYVPIHFVHNSLGFDDLVALYSIGDVCLVTSTRDGMNLVSYEYTMCQQENHGSLILSEFAGAAQSLNGSIIVNPWNTEQVSNSIYEAVTMSEDKRKSNHMKLYRYVNKYTAAFWGLNFIKELERVSEEYDSNKLPKISNDFVLTKLKFSTMKKLIVLDYDCTITQTHRIPGLVKPSQALLDILQKLSKVEDIWVYVTSGRSRNHLLKCFEETGIGLSAEYGCFLKHPDKFNSAKNSPLNSPILNNSLSPIGVASPHSQTRPSRYIKKQGSWYILVDSMITGSDSWRDSIRPLFQHYTQCTPGSFIEEKEINLTWHYENSDLEFATLQANELQLNLEKILSHMIGDGKTDETVFQHLHEGYKDISITCTVGKKQTGADYYFENAFQVETLLTELVKSIESIK